VSKRAVFSWFWLFSDKLRGYRFTVPPLASDRQSGQEAAATDEVTIGYLHF
jgi:hypothetical protein